MPSETALLVIDVQVGLFKGERPVHDGEGLVHRINVVAEEARAHDVPVLYVQDKDAGDEEGDLELHPSLRTRPEEPRFQKSFCDSFYQTELLEHLKDLGVKKLIITGCQTNTCVEMTCRRAVALGFDVVLLADCRSTCDNSFMPAEKTIAYYNIILDGFGAEDGFGNGEHEVLVVPSSELKF